jgi:phosphatidylglycerol lysyltransferase
MSEDVKTADVSLAPSGGKWRRRLRRVTPLLGFAMLAAALFIIAREVSAHDPAEIWSSFARTRPGSAALTLILCLVSFMMLALIERSVLQMLHCEQPFVRVFRNSFVTYGLSNAIGFSYASAPVTRARIYRNRLRAREIGALSAITAASVALGALTAAGGSLLIDPPQVAAAPDFVLRVFGALLLAPAAIWMAASARRDDVSFWGMRFRSLGFRRAALQVGFTTIDWLSTAGILYAFLPAAVGWSYVSFVAVFVSAGLLGAVSGTPGGLGTFEAAILSLAPAAASGPQIIAALVAYRMIFTVFPLCVAAILLGLDFLSNPALSAEENARKSSH